ncbi:MAG TPA: AAA family ATPase [Candidatus Limnocylindria bacterium]
MPPRARPGTARKKPTTTTRAFLFSDLRDYTSYVEAKGDAAAARLLREYRTLVRREVARHEGAEVKTEGDSFYVVFDSPSGALECAVAILRAAAVQEEKDPTAPLRIGIGLHAGETVAYDDQFVGSAVNIASRLAGTAGAMDLLISDTLRGLVRTSQDLAMTDRGPLALKGVAEPIRAWRVEWRERTRETVIPRSPAPAAIASAPASAPAAGQLLCPVVVGRAAETARFDAALAAAIGGAGQTVVLGGEAGVGKTKFVREAQEHASARGARVLVGLTHQSDGTLPYGPFVSAIRSGFHGLDRDELGRVLQRSAPDLAELFPELGKMESAAAPSGVERHRLSVAFQHLFRAFARETPVLVVLEDLHWADETSLELLQHLARELRDARVILLATYRSDEMHRRHPFLRTLAELQRERLVTEIQLKRLTPDETKELIRATMATRDPNVRVSDEFRDALYARSDGNPFFTEELLKALVDSGGVFMQDGGWARKPIDELEIPGSIREAVRARIEELTEDARRTLSVASVIGLRFGFDTLRTAADADEATLERHLREFIEAQLVTEIDEAEEEYSFRHALTREVVYDDLLVRERKRLHRAVADAIAAQPTVEPALVALHFLAAGDNGRAVPKLREAADRAMRASAPREAAAHYERVLDIGVPDDELAELLEQLAEAYHGFDEILSLKTANEAAAAYRERGDRRGTSRMLRLASRNYWLKGDGEPAQRLAQEAIDQVADDESIELARALAHMAGLKMTAGADEPAIAFADRAIALAERFDDTFALSNALISKGSVLARTDAVVGFEIIDRGRQIAMKSGLPITASRGWNNMSLWFRFIGRSTEEQLAFVREGIAWSQAHGVEAGSLSFIRNMHAALLAETGRFDEAIAEYDWIIVNARNALGTAPKAWLVLARQGVAAVRDDVPDILRLGERAGEPQAWVPTFLICAFILYAAGRTSDADQIVSRLADRLRDDEGSRPNASGPWHALTLSVAILAGRDDLVDVVAAYREAPTAGAAEARARAVAFARAFRRGDLAAAGDEMRVYQQSAKTVGIAFPGDVTLIVASSLVAGQRLAPVGSWRGPLVSARGFAERAGAKWWLEVVPEPS